MKHTTLLLYRNAFERERVLSRLSGHPSLAIDCCPLSESWQTRAEPELLICYCRDLLFACQLRQQACERNLLLFTPPELGTTFDALEDTHCRTLNLACPEAVLGEALQALCRQPSSASESAAYLTRRERQILNLYLSGKDTREVAEQLGIQSSTVIAHKKHLFLKSGAHSVSQLLVWAMLKVPR
ncbi:MAG: helix-turn-helix transcriptional regulator [Spirochaetia bacterium]|uniref:helix-turn-helix transcriptional regulator n=1 Tax=Sphaerochaeta sp. TaxID=1972642 RepID=UPI002AA7F6EF|nr:helix-turn-helix domain-containing protein [uncultured Sphaerochaeta sp.]NCC13502.1 helix-turn-helix transcriptional regulator [Spirochaetia bacterium]